MARLGRPPNAIPSVRWEVGVPEDLAATVEILCADPVTGKPRKGARTAFINEALRNEVLRRTTNQGPDLFKENLDAQG